MAMVRKRKAAASGQALAEYGIILVLGVCVCFAALRFMGEMITFKLVCIGEGLLPGRHSQVNC